MITPSPTTKIDPKLARAVLAAYTPASEDSKGFIKLKFTGTSYEIHLTPTGPIAAAVGKRVVGKICAEATRIDTVQTGGQYVEPVYGHPRRIQGRVIAVEEGRVVVDAGMPIHCRPTDSRQKAADFEKGQFVSFDVLDGATFTVEGD